LEIEKVYERLAEKIPAVRIRKNESMAKHTSFKIGGPADLMVLPSDIEELRHVLKVCKETGIDFYIMGNGTNLLVRDKGFRGVIMKIGGDYSSVSVQGEIIRAQAGILLSSLSKIALEHHLEGFEFAGGIPGSLGGAVAMNAGAYGGEIKDIVKSVTAMDLEGNLHQLSNQELNFGYRKSRIQEENWIVLEVEIQLKKGDANQILSITRDLTQRRTAKQPLHLPSAGSVFKRPANHYASKLIEDAGLKGVRVGGARVSEMHAGFIVNEDHATAQDVINLIRLIQKTVRDRFGVLLELEVKIIGEE